MLARWRVTSVVYSRAGRHDLHDVDEAAGRVRVGVVDVYRVRVQEPVPDEPDEPRGAEPPERHLQLPQVQQGVPLPARHQDPHVPAAWRRPPEVYDLRRDCSLAQTAADTREHDARTRHAEIDNHAIFYSIIYIYYI